MLFGNLLVELQGEQREIQKALQHLRLQVQTEGGRSSCELIEYILAAHTRCDGDTLLMVIVTLIFATILGIPLGLLLYVTRKGNF